MAGTVDVGTGTTITHGGTSYAIEILNIDGEVSRAIIDTTHMGTTGARTKRTGDLYDPGSITVRAHFDPDEPAPYDQAEETVTVTFPVPSGQTNGATVAATGAVSRFSFGAPLEDKMTATYTVTFCDDLTWADAS